MSERGSQALAVPGGRWVVAGLSYRGDVSVSGRVCACECVSVFGRRGGGGRGARLDPTIAECYPLPPNPCAPAVSVPVPVPVPTHPPPLARRERGGT